MGTTRIRAVLGDVISWRRTWLFFSAYLFVSQTWAIYVFLYNVPALALRLTFWELLGAASYTLMFVLVEAIILSCLSVAVSALILEAQPKSRF